MSPPENENSKCTSEQQDKKIQKQSSFATKKGRCSTFWLWMQKTGQEGLPIYWKLFFNGTWLHKDILVEQTTFGITHYPNLRELYLEWGNFKSHNSQIDRSLSEPEQFLVHALHSEARGQDAEKEASTRGEYCSRLILAGVQFSTFVLSFVCLGCEQWCASVSRAMLTLRVGFNFKCCCCQS